MLRRRGGMLCGGSSLYVAVVLSAHFKQNGASDHSRVLYNAMEIVQLQPSVNTHLDSTSVPSLRG